MRFAAGAAIALAMSTPALAASTLPDVTEGTLATRDGKDVIPVPLEHTQVTVKIDGFLADVEVEQTFHNPYQDKIEAVYLFPLPTQAAIHDMTITTGAGVIQGEIKLREQAKQVYRAAAKAGQVAALLTQERPNLFTQSVANIEPGAQVVVKIRYVQSLSYENGGYELVFPMVAGPRHVPSSIRKASKLGPDEVAAIMPAILPPGVRSAHDIGLTVELDAGVPIQAVRSTSHRVDVKTPSARQAEIAIAAGDTIPNKDFVLRYDVAGAKPEFAVVAHRDGGEGAFFLMAQPPETAKPEEVTAKEMVFVIDTSSSMAGAPLIKAKEAVRKALAAMGPDDTFQIVRFDDSASALGTKPIANKPRNVDIALAWLDALEAGGGTDMTTGIAAALEFPHDPARLRIVAFLTDGYIGNEDEILALVGEKLGESRLFSFGVGSAVNRYLLEEMALAGRGAVQVVRPDEDTAAAVDKFHARIAQPLLTDVSIEWGGLAVKDVTPARIPDLFAGQPLILNGRYTAGGDATITIRGTSAGKKVSFAVPVTLPEKRAREGVAAVWARARIAELSRRQLRGEQAELKQQIIDLALAHHLMTQYTAFVAVDASRVTAGGEATTVPVPVEVPEGLRGAGYGAGYGGGSAAYGTIGAGYGVASPMISSGSYGVALKSAVDKPTVVYNTAPRADEVSELLDDDGGGRHYDKGGASPEPPAAAPPVASAGEDQARKLEEANVEKATGGPSKSKTGADVRKCYEQALKSAAPGLKGTLTVELDVAENGTVSGVKLSGLDDAGLRSCVTAAAKKWRWKGGARKYTQAFKLQGGE